jgi:hypothetical protein
LLQVNYLLSMLYEDFIVHYWKALQDSTLPPLIPRWNHSMRWAEDPCVKESGLTGPRDARCKRSSPTAAAAPRALSTSPGSSRPRCCVDFRPNKGETISLEFHANRKCIPRARILALQVPNPAFNPQQVLDVVSEFVREHVGLCELARRTEALLKFVVKSEVDVHLLIGRTVESPVADWASPQPEVVASRKSTNLACWYGIARSLKIPAQVFGCRRAQKRRTGRVVLHGHPAADRAG